VDARTRLLGVPLDALSPERLLDRVVACAKGAGQSVIAYANVHVLNLAFSDPALHRFLCDADVVYCDGSGVALAAQALGTPVGRRLTAADFVWPLMRRLADEGIPVFLLAGEAESIDAAAARLRREVPGLRIAGVASGYVAEADEPELVEAINDSGARVLYVGMGSPRQERWVQRNRDRLELPAIWVVGALFDFVSGRLARGPAWMTDHHLEWVARLWVEPRRLAARYLIGNPLFAFRVLRERWRRRSRRAPLAR
jgi:N-acetylglucosaminyldiphosphoundecaprenol N-acetyl-beta-D-mannosaminyltransferase